MNTNKISSKAPEKIFLLKNRLGVILNSFCVEPDKVLDNIEYVRKDAFIKKAYKWIKTRSPYGYFENEFKEETINFVKLAEDFKTYIKGE